VISIIIPTLNESDTLAITLKPLQAFRPTQIEIIVVDGGSHDDTISIASTLADKIFSTNKGRARQMNAGTGQATGEVLLYLHADTQLPGNAISLIEQHALPGQWGRFDVQLNSPHWLLRINAWLMNYRSCLTGIVTGDQGLFVHRTMFEEIGGFPDIPLMEDIAISKKLKRYNRPICLKSRITVNTRYWEQHGVWHSIFRMWGIRLAYFLGIPAEHLVKKYYR
jgi:rSAM/selenodomain-associated transferase 2